MTIVLAGLISGTLDLLAAFASYVLQGATVVGILKYIASGLLGAAAQQGGLAMAWIGLKCHFALTMTMAALFRLAALKYRPLTSRLWLWGSAYGVLTWAAMVYVVVPRFAVVGWKLPEG
ncbi:MAG: hypothetical protein JO006_01055 [Paucibacter sp.]|nr:hypothetical protein [Roseateles sp.]